MLHSHKRTALPVFGGTKLAEIVSTLVGLEGGQVSFTTTTSGPGVSGILVDSSVAPLPLSLMVMVPNCNGDTFQIGETDSATNRESITILPRRGKS